MTTEEANREELQRAVGLLGKTTRPGRLLEYLGTRFFAHQESKLTEFAIAADVFGRSLSTFDATEDAVVRVESHRLRKKLREIYEKDDRKQGVQISLPAGTYVLQFTPIRRAEQEAGAEVSAAGARSRSWMLYLGAAAVLALLMTAAYVLVKRGNTQPSVRTTQVQAPSTEPGQATTAAEAVTELHILAGYTGSEIIDNSGVRWTADRYFTKGKPWSRMNGLVRGTSRPFLFAQWRTGEFGYDIPLARGSYELRLYFVSPFRPGEESFTGFDVFANGKMLLDAYDVVMNANGVDLGDEQVFRDITPDESGFLRLSFGNRSGAPRVSAVEVTPGTPGQLKPIRLIMQPTSFVDHQGQRWRADDYYQNGWLSSERKKVSGTEDPELFSGERYGRFRYAIPVDRRGRYTVILHFAEFYYGPQTAPGGGVGNRIFHVYCNGQTLLKNFDIFKEAGSLRLVSKTFKNLEPSAQGKLNLDFEPVLNNATVSGIEVLEEAR